MKSLLASVYSYPRLPVIQRICFEGVADRLSYTRHFSYLHAGFCQFSSMSKAGSLFPDILNVKERFLNMPLEEKRKQYKRDSFSKVDEISTWQNYFLKSKEHLKMQFSTMFNSKPVDLYTADAELNKKVSIWEGNITHLETDAIVNAANASLLGGGGVDGAIHSAAGPYLKTECALLRGCAEGGAKITGGYCLPAKYVIHTVGPQGEKSDKLESCYRTSLELLITNKLRTVAFPCVSTGIYGYPQEKAAHVALKTVRTFLEKNRDLVDRVIFCLFLTEDVKIYENLMQIYFPVVNMTNNL